MNLVILLALSWHFSERTVGWAVIFTILAIAAWLVDEHKALNEGSIIAMYVHMC